MKNFVFFMGILQNFEMMFEKDFFKKEGTYQFILIFYKQQFYKRVFIL